MDNQDRTPSTTRPTVSDMTKAYASADQKAAADEATLAAVATAVKTVPQTDQGKEQDERMLDLALDGFATEYVSRVSTMVLGGLNFGVTEVEFKRRVLRTTIEFLQAKKDGDSGAAYLDLSGGMKTTEQQIADLRAKITALEVAAEKKSARPWKSEPDDRTIARDPAKPITTT